VSKKFKTVDEYLSSLDPGTKSIVKELRKAIKGVAPKAEDVISYNIAALKQDGLILIWYAGWKEHVSVYPASTAMIAAIKGLATYAGGKGTIKFPSDKPLPVGMIEKIVRFRIKENADRVKAKNSKEA
jgi:uncharacterized protein YdhG (YjbR/CyaY superfamily)